jgi:hypothetical protein
MTARAARTAGSRLVIIEVAVLERRAARIQLWLRDRALQLRSFD